MRATIGAVLLAACCAASFHIGRLYESRRWEIASPAVRAAWKAKEGPTAERLLHAQRAIELDEEYLLGYVLKARAWYESGRSEAPEHVTSILRQGMDAAEVDHALYLLWQANLQRQDMEGARLYRECLLRVGGEWGQGN